jgi:transposase
MPLYGGMDLHANNSVVVLLDAQDQGIYQQHFSNHRPTMVERLAPDHADLKGVVVESTDHWYWLVEGLREAGSQVHLAHPAAMPQYSGLKYTDDHAEARWLAHMLRRGVLPEGYIYPKAERAVRGVWRTRAHRVAQHTANVLSGQNILARNTGSRFGLKQMHQ